MSGLYTGTYGAGGAGANGVIAVGGNAKPQSDARASQPYASSYGVTGDMLQYDKDRGVYSEKDGYSKNPTARKAADSVRDGKILDSHGDPMDGHYTYAVSTDGDLIIGERNGNGKDGLATPHPTLIGGKNPQVKVAGIVTMSGGKIVKYDNESGHFKPNILSMGAADEAFSNLPNSVFHRNFNKNMGRR